MKMIWMLALLSVAFLAAVVVWSWPGQNVADESGQMAETEQPIRTAQIPSVSSSDPELTEWWTSYSKEQNHYMAKRREGEEAPYDKNKDMDVDRDQLDAFKAFRTKRRHDEGRQAIAVLIDQYDWDHDKQLTTTELAAVLKDFSNLKAGNDPVSKARYFITALKHCDFNGDKYLSDVEQNIAMRLRTYSMTGKPGTERICRLETKWAN